MSTPEVEYASRSITALEPEERGRTPSRCCASRQEKQTDRAATQAERAGKRTGRAEGQGRGLEMAPLIAKTAERVSQKPFFAGGEFADLSPRIAPRAKRAARSWRGAASPTDSQPRNDSA